MVFVLSKNKRPLNMCTEAKARFLLDKGNAVVHKMYPFTIRLKTVIEEPILKKYKVKIDPGSKYTGLSIIDEDNNVCFLMELEHRGDMVKKLLETRSAARRNRRNREIRHRRCKFGNNRPKKNTKASFASNRKEGWLPPSVKSILDNTVNWIKKLQKMCNITSIAMENVKFDTQLLENPNIQGVEYQQGTLFGYEVKEYLLHKFGHVCQYCKSYDEKSKKWVNSSKDSVLEIEHMHSKKNNGSDRVTNLAIACHTCNQDKGGLSLDQWYDTIKNSKSKLNKVRAENIKVILDKGLKSVSYKYTAKINSMRRELCRSMRSFNINFRTASGGKTKFNRLKQELPKQHYYDALCVDSIPEDKFNFKTNKVLCVKACGRGSRLRGTLNSCGIIMSKNFPKTKMLFGFQTGDIAKADVPVGKKAGAYVGRVAVRSSGSFNITISAGTVQGINHKYFTLLQRNDGYSYNIKDRDITTVSKAVA